MSDKAFKPNILLIVTDQQRWDTVGPNSAWVETPNLDKLARRGALFENCITNSPVCVPARASLVSGLYPHNTNIWSNGCGFLPPETDTWMKAVAGAGYKCSLIGKAHLFPHGRDVRESEHHFRAQGFAYVDEIGGPRECMRLRCNMTDLWRDAGLLEKYREDMKRRTSPDGVGDVSPSVIPLELFADTYVGREAKNYIESYDDEEPWFCWVGFGGPHEPWDAPEPYASMYAPGEMPLPRPPLQEPHERPTGTMDWRHQSSNHALSQHDFARMRANYAGNVTLIDHQIGEILGAVEKRGEIENTVVIFTSDHGELNGDHNLIHKAAFFDGAVRIPLIIAAPAISMKNVGSTATTHVELMDLGAFIADIAGADLRKRHHAKSLRPALQDPSQMHRQYAISEFKNEIMYVDDQWKMAVNRTGEPYFLIDLENDPAESVNRAGDPEMKPVRDMLMHKLFTHLLSTQQYMARG